MSSYTVADEFVCYKVCSLYRGWHGTKYVSAIVTGDWCVEYVLGEFVGRPNIHHSLGAGGLLAFDHLMPAAMFAKTMYPNGILFRATGRGRYLLYSNISRNGYRRKAVTLGCVDSDSLVLDGWASGTVSYDEIRLDERIPLNADD